MKLQALRQEYLIEIEVRKYTPKTIKGYRNNLNLFLRFCEEELEITEIEEISLAVVKRFTQFMSEKGKKGTYINTLLKNIKSFIQYCYEEGYGGFNTKKSFKWCVEEKPIILTYQPADVRQMLRDCQGYEISYLSVITPS